MKNGTSVGWAILVLLLAGVAIAAPPSADDDRTPNSSRLKQIDDDVYINANRILMFVTNHGNFGRDLGDVFGSDAGTFYPFTTIDAILDTSNANCVLYAAGLWLGGKVNGQTRVAIADYQDEYVPGPMAGGTYQWDRPEFRVYKLHRDSLADNPNTDYIEWPADQGAPVKADGTPKMVGDQMLWTVYNDADPRAHDNFIGNTDPLGIEIQQAVWAAPSYAYSDTAVVSEKVLADHIGPGKGSVEISVADPHALTGHSYFVTFHESPYPQVDWDLIDATTGQTVLSHQTAPAAAAHGLAIRITLFAKNGVDSILEVSNGSGPVIPPDNVMYSLNSTADWYVDTSPSGHFERLNWLGLMGNSSWEFRFTVDGSWYYDWSTDMREDDRAPFEVWNIGVRTPDDPSDDVRLNFAYLDDDGDGQWSWDDRIYVIETPYVEPTPMYTVYDFPDDFEIGRIKFMGYFGGHSGTILAPATGTVVRFVTYDNAPLSLADTFSFVAPGYTTVPVGGENNAVYLKYKLHNRGGNTIQDCYIALWADPDLGGMGDDLVGCDTLSSTWFCYNGGDFDNQYGTRCPSVGFKALYGPLVPSPADTAVFDGHRRIGYRNLPMTAFAKYINGTDPNDFNETYNYMRGLEADGTPWPNGTKYAVPGDPVTGVGDIDTNPADRRLMASFGPFTFLPGDSQFVLIKMAVGQGNDRLHSISRLREILDAPVPVDPADAVLRVGSKPDTLSIIALRALTPQTAAIRIGYDEVSPIGPELDLASIGIAELPPADSVRVLQSVIGFNGPVVSYYFSPTTLLQSYGTLWGVAVRSFTVTGSYVGGGAFTAPGSLVIRGHRKGDFNVDGNLTVSDLTGLVNFLFRGGDAPQYVEAVDLNGSGAVNVSDLPALIDLLFRN